MAPRLEYSADLAEVFDGEEILARFARQGWVGDDGEWPHAILEEHLFWARGESGPEGPFRWDRALGAFVVVPDVLPHAAPTIPD